MTGKRFGHLVAIKRVEDIVRQDGAKVVAWLCECDCGNSVIVPRGALRSGNTKSCGCMRTETLRRMLQKTNQYEFRGEIGVGYTAKGETFFFDAADFDKVKKYCWRKNEEGYIVSTVNRRNFYFHRLIMNASENEVVDHINHDTTDNRKSNLRCVSQSQNMQNARNSRRNVNGVKGVNWDKKWGMWFSRITVNHKTFYLGSYKTYEEAVAARKAAEEKYFGEFSYENSIRASPIIVVA